ncbi:MAG: energy-coupling factor transporter transmembrane component T [Bacillota bacterium]|nr:energy-coupling factor transporter transmembrane component T [Bacillota bacterium]
MMDITIGQFFPGDSIIHRMDPRTKILFTMLYMIVIFLVNNFAGFAVIFLFILAVIVSSRVPVKYYFKGLKTILILMLFTALFNLFLTPGNTIYTLPYLGWTISDSGIRFAAFMLFRLTFLLIGTSALTFTTSPVVLTDGLEYLMRPFSKIGVPAHEIAMMMTIALRFIPTFAEETDRIKKAQSARGADFESGSILKRAKAMVPILVPLFVGAFRRADDLAIAMEARCYRGGEGRTSLKQLSFSYADIYGLASAAIILTAVIICNIYSHF